MKLESAMEANVILEKIGGRDLKYPLNKMFYDHIIRPILFRLDPEFTHNSTIKIGSLVSKSSLACQMLKRMYDTQFPTLKVKVWGIEFENPVGLAAGFDKHGQVHPLIASLGFGHMEVGSVSYQYWRGNPSPTLLRLPQDGGLINRLGLNSVGADIVHSRLTKLQFQKPLGVNLVKTADPDIAGEEAVDDYFQGFCRFYSVGDFTTLNLSCPNTSEGRTFEDPELLEPFLKKIKQYRLEGNSPFKPVLAKISPDLSDNELDQILELCQSYEIDGCVIGNTTTKRENLRTSQTILEDFGCGGVSGKPLKQYVQEMVGKVFARTNGRFPIVALGGVGCDPKMHPAQEVWEYLNMGATLVQLYTGLIYRGPSLLSVINQGLANILSEKGISSLDEFLEKR